MGHILTELLTSKAREACRNIDYTEVTYQEIKQNLLHFFNVTEESQRKKFRE